MKKKCFFFTAGTAFVLCAALLLTSMLFAKADTASAQDNNTPYLVVYEKGDKNFTVPEIDENLLNDPKHNLMENFVDDFDYSNSYVVEYPLGDTRFDDLVSSTDIETHLLTEVRGDYVPTSFWNLTNNDYQYEFVNMTQYVYTDFYFNVDPDNCIAMSMGSLDSNGASMKIKLFELGNDAYPVQQWTGDPETIVGLGFCGLNQYKNYYIKFESYQATSVSGSGRIMHD